MSTHKLDLNHHAPTAVDCEACQNRFIERLLRVTGIHSARIESATLQVEVDGSNGGWRDQASQIGAGLADGVSHAHLRLGGLDCPSCAQEIVAALREMPGVTFAEASFTGRRLAVEYDPGRVALGQIEGAVRGLGFSVGAEPRGAGPASWRLAATGVLLALGALLAGTGEPLSWVPLLVVTLAEGRSIFAGAVSALKRRTISMNVLMAIALGGAAALGEWTEAASVAWLAALGGAIQDWASGRTRQALDQLIRLAPASARVEGEMKPVDTVRTGEVYELLAGERFPLDGTVVEGLSDADEAPITGESVPVPKATGDAVFAGAVNLSGTLRVQVTRMGTDSALARMIRMIEQAQERRAPIQSWVDRFAAVYTPAVVLIALLVSILPPLVAGQLWTTWIERGLWLLVVACPCALIVSTPVAVVSAIGAASRLGAIVKGGAVLEALARARAVVFDKTGTLTMAELAVAGYDSDQALTVAAALGRHSSHPASKAVCAAAGPAVPAATAVQTIPGCGLVGEIDGLGSARTGRPSWLGSPNDGAGGEVTVGVELNGEYLGTIRLADQPRADAARVVDAMRAMGIKRVIMLSGDASDAVERVAAATGIQEIAGGLLPEEKERRIAALEEETGPVIMLGDGINDLAAMARSSVGVAMGAAGTEAASESAGVVLMRDDLSALPLLVGISRRAVGIMRQNVLAALTFKLGLVLAAIPAPLPLWTAVFGDVGVTVLVTLNAARLLLRPVTVRKQAR